MYVIYRIIFEKLSKLFSFLNLFFYFILFLFYLIFIFILFYLIFLCILFIFIWLIRYMLVELASTPLSLILCGNYSWSFSSWRIHWSRSPLWVWVVVVLPSLDPANNFMGGIHWVRWWWWWINMFFDNYPL